MRTLTVLEQAREGEPTVICTEQAVGARYRVWIVRYEGVPPDDCHDVPPGAVTVEPAE